MKNIQYILLMLLISGFAYAQNKSINYKALIKDDSNNVLSNQNIIIEFSILEGPEIAFSDVIYAESHTVSTDDNGIVIVNIGEGIPLSGFEDVYNQLDWRSMSFFGSRFLKVQIDSGSGLTDMGTTEFKSVPFALFAEQSNNTGLELINEGSGNGWRLIGRPEDFYGPIAVGAVDLSYSWGPSPTNGATGNYATAVGLNTTASGQSSFASGVGTIASQAQATAMGAGTVASGHSSTAMGIGTRAEAPNSTAIGLYNIGGGDPLLASSTDPLFEIGNGNYVDGTNDNRSNALTVLRNGNATLSGTLTQNSDKRLKTNIAAIPYGLKTILKLKPVSYNWKKYPEQVKKSFGLIAQDVQPIINEIVSIGIDKDQTLSVSYNELIPILIKAIQEQQDIINKQDAKINGLTAELEQLKTLDQRVKQLEALTNGQQ
ncbi:tail fiber domain-containing protein [Sabulilitoribacter multivorans]|uniref:Tail fiber domain-containing protein n=1 Tax=Flaviramulus multivorans TaxID=1304750 RepID=A0ABS9IM93_9FLAO|nr:tail fiber domain-containing protein [Flaviramulus multivorans]MCF7561729.1 tail fiber domain-containing protein [Flaviramulus multivorans]